MMRTRVLSALVALPLVLLVVWWGEPLYSLVIAVAALWGWVEFTNLGPIKGRLDFSLLGALSILLLLTSAFFGYAWLAPVVVFVILTTSAFVLWRSPIQEASGHWVWAMAGVLYLGGLLGHFIALRHQAVGREWMFFLLLVTFACDTTAFFVGRGWGRRKMAYAISPGKTWEGAGAGLAAGILVGPLLLWVLGLSVSWWHGLVLGGLVGVFGQVGDLTESALKRGAQVKDAGAFMPGHGGILDRMDSLLFTVVVLYYYVLWLGI